MGCRISDMNLEIILFYLLLYMQWYRVLPSFRVMARWNWNWNRVVKENMPLGLLYHHIPSINMIHVCTLNNISDRIILCSDRS